MIIITMIIMILIGIIKIAIIMIMQSIFRKTGHVCSMSRKSILFYYSYRWLQS